MFSFILQITMEGAIKISLTNVVVHTSLNVHLPLDKLIWQIGFAKYNKRRWSGLSWNHPKIQGSAMLFSNGRLVSQGAKSFPQARKIVRQYARLLQKLGYDVKLSPIHLVTATALATLPCPINLSHLSRDYPNAVWESELFNACIVKKDGLHYSVFASGRVVICGIKRITLISNQVKTTLAEFMLF